MVVDYKSAHQSHLKHQNFPYLENKLKIITWMCCKEYMPRPIQKLPLNCQNFEIFGITDLI